MMRQTIYEISYDDYMKQLNDLGWKKTYQVITEKDTDIVTIMNGKIGETALILYVTCPNDKKMSIRGIRKNASSYKNKYALNIRFADTSDTEINKLTLIEIKKAVTMTDTYLLTKRFYFDFLDRNNPYRFAEDIEIDSNNFLTLWTVRESPTGNLIFPDVNIDASHVKFSLGFDVWSKQ